MVCTVIGVGHSHTIANGHEDDKERLSFLTDLTKKVNKPSSQDAYVYSLVAAAEVKLRLHDLSGARKDLDTADSILDTFDSVETEVHATFYRINASYYQVGFVSPFEHMFSADHVRPTKTSAPTIRMHSSTSPALTSLHSLR